MMKKSEMQHSNNVARQKKNHKKQTRCSEWADGVIIVFFSVHVHNENDDLVILFVSFEQQQGEQGLRSAIFEALICFLVEEKGGDGVKDQQSTYHYPLFTNCRGLHPLPLELEAKESTNPSHHSFSLKVPVASDAVGFKQELALS